ncbi:hypothetical protein [Streptomyces olivochromogenes]|uniref:Uncharacterized protein n=1 Tax=Streptomyces olivochromogenes TaxID=1963 RepID=A0A250VT95_STROL|nr:hypothetical protein [Streptomyces olivochromogenes]GAX57316.1 hypothetical protein SO3561_08886 [Streptomyces olivochromogenes]
MTTITDDFNRADSTNLGANWVEVSGDWSIISNQLSSGSAGGTIILRAAGTMATNDHSAQVTIAATAAVSHGVWCRGNSNISQGYLWRNDGTSWNLFSVVGGSFTSIGSFAGAAVAGDIAKVQAVGSTIKGFVNGVQRVSVTDTAVTTGTSVGLRAESTNLLRFDDFTAADVTTGTTGDAAFPGTATLSATGLRATAGSSALAATATLSTSGLRATTGDTALTTTAGLTADGIRATAGTATFATTATLTASGTLATSSNAALTATTNLTAAGLVDHPGLTALAATAALTAQGQAAYNAAAALTATATLTASGITGTAPTLGDATLSATGTLTAAGTRATIAGAALNAAATLTAAGSTAAAGQAALAATATLTASGTTLGTHDDINVTVGAPYSPWAAGQPYVPTWTVQAPQADDLEVGAPC